MDQTNSASPAIQEPDYGDQDIPEIDLPGKANATDPIPVEVPNTHIAHLNS